jgi:3-isopropylmalate/(R)-2-methylmalate dehydratase small subunit
MKPIAIKGRIWVIQNAVGKRIDDIDTDMIFHNKYLHITDKTEMGQYTFDNLDGWRDFSKKAAKGDILIVGKNFGCGSSRQQAVDCFMALGIKALIGESFGAIYKRNAINSGMPLLECIGVFDAGLISGDVVKIHFETGVISKGNKTIINAKPLTQIQLDIYHAGNLFAYGKNLE